MAVPEAILQQQLPENSCCFPFHKALLQSWKCSFQKRCVRVNYLLIFRSRKSDNDLSPDQLRDRNDQQQLLNGRHHDDVHNNCCRAHGAKQHETIERILER